MASMSFSMFKRSLRPEHRFAPGLLLWLFTGFFLPLFVVLGFWQLSRADQKSQWLTELKQAPVALELLALNESSLYRTTLINAQPVSDFVFLLDNKTYQGRFGYEQWCLFATERGVIAASLGWVAGFSERTKLPETSCQISLNQQAATLRMPPKNPLFDAQSNSRHSSDKNIWIVQTLSSDWLMQFTGEPIVAFVQLNNPKPGINIWQPSTVSPEKHFAYAIQWFAMAAALLGMFIFAGIRFGNRSRHD